MRFLYRDSWAETPDPMPFPGCLVVRVSHAATPGGTQVESHSGSMALALDVVRRSPRAVKRAFRYSLDIGPVRTMAKIRSNLLAYRDKIFDSLATVAGVVESTDVAAGPVAGTKVAGYRTLHPLWADRIVMHPGQVAPIPAGLKIEDAATVYYFSLALEAARRLEEDQTGAPVILCGDTLPCRILGKMLAGSGREVIWPALSAPASPLAARALAGKGAGIVIGDAAWLEAMIAVLPGGRIICLGLPAGRMDVESWRRLEERWIGLPHPEVRNLHPLSGLPLDLPDYLNGPGLAAALADMAARGLSPSELLTPLEVDRAAVGTTVDLGKALLLHRGEMATEPVRTVRRGGSVPAAVPGILRVGLVGLGMWARGNLVPFLRQDRRVRLVMAADRDPVRLLQGADLFGIPLLAADAAEVCASPQIDAVFISTWHDAHGEIAARALEEGKKVFVEKPPVVSHAQLDCLAAVLRGKPGAFLAVGYNRAHSPLTGILRDELSRVTGPVTVTAVVREPSIPPTHYYYWPGQGSRILGNGCHWIDYAFHLLLPRRPSDIRVIPALAGSQDNNVIVMRYADGSLVSLTFTDRGESLIGGDEIIDIKAGDSGYLIQDFTECRRYREGKRARIWRSAADRGWAREMRDVVDGMLAPRMPRPAEEVLLSALLVLEAGASFREGGEVRKIAGPRAGGDAPS